MAGSYIVAGARTPIGKMSGALASFSAADLGSIAIKAALERAGVSPNEVDHVIMGQVLMAGQGQVPSRQAAVKAGIPMSVPAINVNKVCLSGLNAIYLADQMIQAGDADIVIAGGMESMTNAPYIASGARGGFRYGNTELKDAIIADGLWCSSWHLGSFCLSLCWHLVPLKIARLRASPFGISHTASTFMPFPFSKPLCICFPKLTF